MLTIGFAALLALAQSPPPQAPKLDAAFVVLIPQDHGFAMPDDPLVRDTERLLAALQSDGALRYRRSRVEREALRPCLEGDSEPSAERLACLRRLLPASEAGVPVVAIVIGYTRERGAWQRMHCIGPRGEGVQRYIYVNEIDHPRADIRARSRLQGLSCVGAALSG